MVLQMFVNLVWKLKTENQNLNVEKQNINIEKTKA